MSVSQASLHPIHSLGIVLTDCDPSKVLDLLTDDADATLIGSVEFEHTTLESLGSVDFSGQCEDRGGFPYGR